MKRCETHLGTIADEHEHKRRFEPERIQVRCVGKHFFQNQRDTDSVSITSGHCEEENSQQRKRDSDRANEKIFPRRLKRAMMAMEVNQRSAGQCRRLDSHPKKPEVLAKRNHSHRGQKKKQAASKASLARIRKKKSLLEIRVLLAAFSAQVRNPVEA